MSERSKIGAFYTASGLQRFAIEIRHPQLNKFQIIRGDNAYIVEQKAFAKMAAWDEMWANKVAAQRKRDERERIREDRNANATEAEYRTSEAISEHTALEGILIATLSVDDTIDWNQLKSTKDFPELKPKRKPIPPEPKLPRIPNEPTTQDAAYQVQFGILDRILRKRSDAKIEQAKSKLSKDHAKWAKHKSELEAKHRESLKAYRDHLKQLENEYEENVLRWENAKVQYERERTEVNDAIETRKTAYFEKDPGSIVDYCDMVLSNSKYHDYFPQSFDLDFNPDNGLLIVDYQIPSRDVIPTLKEVKYIASRNEFQEKHISDAQLNKLYDSILYQIALRTIHELFEADAVNVLRTVVFNGYVTSINRSTGQSETACVLSVQTGKEEFIQINLANVDPRACFKNLKGVGSAKLHTMTPIAPLLKINRDDQRFIEAYAVANSIQEGDNLALMDWQDFEHLIRELFEKEFSNTGGEVKVTRASRDGGIDAVIFDPDPIRGGKSVIQAKRYTNTVGVGAVRELYGAVINEGANKGILVSTSDYGSDAYEFARDKPIILLSGGNLLHMLEKHGHKARIDLQEAKSILAERS